MKTRFITVMAIVLVVLETMLIPMAHGDQRVVRRSLDDAFFDTLFLEGVEPIRSQMPSNWSDSKRNLLAGVRVDNLDAVAAGGPYDTLEEMLQAFYDNQIAFNNDPNRNHIEMHGTVREMVEADGTVVIVASIAYKNLPLTLYKLDTWDDALLVKFDPAQAKKVLAEGSLNAWFYVEMEIPSAGAPLLFWDSVFSGGLRRNVFVGTGKGWLLDENGERSGRAIVDIRQDCGGDGSCTKEVVKYTRIGRREQSNVPDRPCSVFFRCNPFRMGRREQSKVPDRPCSPFFECNPFRHR